MTTKITPIKSGRIGEGEWHSLRQGQWHPWKLISVHLLLQYHLLWSLYFAPGLEGLWILILQRKSPRVLQMMHLNEGHSKGGFKRKITEMRHARGLGGADIAGSLPTGSLFHQPAEQAGSWFLARLFCKAGDLYLCQGGNHPIYIQTSMAGLLAAGSISLPTWWGKTKSRGQLLWPRRGPCSTCGKAKGSGWVWKRHLIWFSLYLFTAMQTLCSADRCALPQER